MGGSIVTRSSKSYMFHIICLLITVATAICVLGSSPTLPTVYAEESTSDTMSCTGDSFLDTAWSIYDTSIRYRRKLCIIQWVNNKFFPNDILKKSDMIARMYRAWYKKTSSDTISDPITRWAFAQYMYDRIDHNNISIETHQTQLINTIPAISRNTIKENIYTTLHWYIYKT